MLNEDLSKDLTIEEFRRFRDLIHRHSGIYLEESKLDSLRISLVTRATRLGYVTLNDYYEALGRDDHEFNELLNLVTINETSFFRFPAQFDALRDSVIPAIMAGKEPGNRDIRVWSAGCSTGEEPYSIAMALLDSGMMSSGWKPQVLGTDVSTKALARAKNGVYGKRAMMNVSPEVVARHFERTMSGEYRVNDRVRSLVDFGYQNLIKEPYPLSLMGNWDIIFCRNVTIYFRIESTRRVVRNFHDSLNEGGYLFIGHSETLTSISDDFEAVELGGVFLYRKTPAKRAFSFGQTTGRSGDDAAKTSRTATGTSQRRPRPGAGSPGARSGRAGDAGGRASVRSDPASVSAPPVASDPATTDTGVDVVSALEEARKDLKEGRPERVVETAGSILDADPNNADAHLLLGYVHADTGDYEKALAECHKALAINPLLPVARYILGIIYQRQGDSVRAISELKKTVYIDADFALAHLNLANIYKAQRQFDAAAKEYENALKALKKSPEGDWTEFSGGFQADLLARTCERSLIECRKAAGKA